jgi:hypothetical protein
LIIDEQTRLGRVFVAYRAFWRVSGPIWCSPELPVWELVRLAFKALDDERVDRARNGEDAEGFYSEVRSLEGTEDARGAYRDADDHEDGHVLAGGILLQPLG